MPPRALQTIVETLRRCQQGLATDAPMAERHRLIALHDEALQLLEEATAHSRASTAALARRVASLEDQLRSFSPGERRAAICERMGISRSRYYELRKLCES